MTYWSVWWRVFAWLAAVAGAIGLIAVGVVFLPAPVWTWIGYVAAALGFVSYLSFFIWMGQSGRNCS